MMKQKKAQTIIMIVIIIIAAVVGGYFFLKQPEPEVHVHDDSHPHDNIEIIEETEQPSEPTNTIPTTQTKEIDVIARQWEFDPDPITVNEGDKVILNIESIDVAHGIAIPDFEVSERLNAGTTTRIEFLADKKGSFTFFCNVACGSGHSSMRGTLIVE